MLKSFSNLFFFFDRGTHISESVYFITTYISNCSWDSSSQVFSLLGNLNVQEHMDNSGHASSSLSSLRNNLV